MIFLMLKLKRIEKVKTFKKVKNKKWNSRLIINTTMSFKHNNSKENKQLLANI
jgi:hypothetical protein